MARLQTSCQAQPPRHSPKPDAHSLTRPYCTVTVHGLVPECLRVPLSRSRRSPRCLLLCRLGRLLGCQLLFCLGGCGLLPGLVPRRLGRNLLQLHLVRGVGVRVHVLGLAPLRLLQQVVCEEAQRVVRLVARQRAQCLAHGGHDGRHEELAHRAAHIRLLERQAGRILPGRHLLRILQRRLSRCTPLSRRRSCCRDLCLVRAAR
mmetsp:Transcript_7029/g.17429  ORF Transcript_7029/g.17429 Transcript_7029/m.17429 type:complete len:204 (-) Transcript_7029:75-686(-)